MPTPLRGDPQRPIQVARARLFQAAADLEHAGRPDLADHCRQMAGGVQQPATQPQQQLRAAGGPPRPAPTAPKRPAPLQTTTAPAAAPEPEKPLA